MRLLYIHQYFTFPTSGGGTRSYDLSTKFLENGIQPIIITSNGQIEGIKFNGKKWAIIERDGLILHILNSPVDNTSSFITRIIKFIEFTLLASFRVLKINGDFVLATSTPLTVGIPALIKKWLGNTPFIFEVRDVWPEVPIAMGVIKNKYAIYLLEKLEKIIYKNASHVVTLSEDMTKSVKSKGIDNNKITTIPNISEINRFSNTTHDPCVLDKPEFKNKKIVLYAGTVGIVNGLDYLVYLASKFRNNLDVVFVVIGKGNRLQQVIDLAKENNVYEKNLYFLPPVSKNDLPNIYSRIDIASSFVCDIPALWSNSANKFFDTLAAKKPILINHLGWQADEINKEKIGLVLPNKIEQINESYDLLYQYLSDKNTLNQSGENAFHIAKNKYSLEIAVDKYLNILNY
ncbi:glycosyltransferase family 4 protein [Limibacter armeniacum]|uniref:glycosyltransferase family 4 protein n=1 Tax=Limibacter armeniacum TaxID=466084 RepID=UPI002FE54D5E